MPTRNTGTINQIIKTLGALVTDKKGARARLEEAYNNKLLLVAGHEDIVAKYAEQLRLAITEEERGPVLDYIQKHGLATINIDQVEEAINTLFPDRFIEP